MRRHLSAKQGYPTNNRLSLQLFLITGILLIAAFLRLWQISTVPPGLFSDESYNVLQAQEIVQGKSWPIFITGNNGYEPIVVYLTAFILKIMGPVSWAGRLAMAWAGIIGVAATIRCGKEMFPGRKVGMLAGAALAALFWHVDFSRFGVEPILAAVLAACSMAAFWRAVRTNSRWAYIVTGICLGLGLYTYRAFRVFLIIPLGAFIALWISRRITSVPNQRSLLIGGGLMGSAALLVFAPLGLFFLQNPEWFSVRVQQTMIPLNTEASTINTLLSNTWAAIGGLVLEGDANWRHNFAGRPALDILQALFFIAGLGVMFRDWPRTQSWALWIWLFGGLLPSILSIGAPHFGRMTIVTPALALIVALGMELICNSFPWRLGNWLVGIAICLSIALTTRDYFVLWANRPEVFDMFEGPQTWAGRALQSAPTDASLFATSFSRPAHSSPGFSTTVALVGPQAAQNLRTFYGQTCLVAPYQTASATIYAIPANDQSTLSSLTTAFPAGSCSLISTIGDKPDTYLCQIPPGETAQVPVMTAKPAFFGDLVKMWGYTLDTKSVSPGEQLQLTFVWQATSVSEIPYKAFVHLIGPPQVDGSIIYAQQDMQPCAGSYPTWWWRPDEIIIDTYSIPVPLDTPSGTYWLQTGWYEDPSEGGIGARLSAVDATGQILGDIIPLEQVQVVSTVGLK
ncbi:MAG: glycosyltransferase family 39 protein [Anaerolineae bacterium]|nr:glycosyltransferase family 39 protein [Anaerolineae bacterium]